ncbi:MopE-related protein [Sorangium sp. So ce726]|uniref:MYXO-CTERM sorting domain-containing protein n=1 Tax=Sorangium sp. So ce726 TaxID=3133319 RepID=UPI003F5F8DAB
MMKYALTLAGALSIGLSSLTASALVTQPNGSVMPQDSRNNEVQLYTLFDNRGEALDYQADGNTEPSTFSPLCGFTAELVLRQTGSRLGVGWYNVDPAAAAPPARGDIHEIVPAGAQVGTVITAADIRSDLAYAGGQIGFALLGSQIHYSEQRWNQVCTGCTTPGPWVTAVIYASTVTPNAFYVAFEDGSVGPNPGDFNNDGDYNDYVYFFSGLTCTGGGEPCDTGLPGVCAPGVTQCAADGLTCQGLVPSSQETCDGLDNDCNGTTDEGELCPPEHVCDRGVCVQACGRGEFVCPPDKACNAAGFCVEPACAEVPCDVGEVCVGGRCRAPCDGVQCPSPTVCRVGVCVDPCSNVTCEEGTVCDGGVCKPECPCTPCPSGRACEEASGLCRESACVGVECPPGQRCDAGACVDSCAGAVCPSGQTCAGGACVEDTSTTAASGAHGSTGASLDSGAGGGLTDPASSGATGGSGGVGGGSGGGGSGGAAAGGSGADGGCGCTVAGAHGSLGAPLAAIALALAGAIRRRQRGGAFAEGKEVRG